MTFERLLRVYLLTYQVVSQNYPKWQMFSYTGAFLNFLRVSCRILDIMFEIELNACFWRLVDAEENRTEWSGTLRHHSFQWMPTPSILSADCTVLGTDWSGSSCSFPESRRASWDHSSTRSWLHVNVSGIAIHFDRYDFFTCKFPSNLRNKGGGVVSFICRRWCESCSLFHFNSSRLTIPPSVASHAMSTLFFASIYIAPDTQVPDFRQFTDELSIHLTT